MNSKAAYEKSQVLIPLEEKPAAAPAKPTRRFPRNQFLAFHIKVRESGVLINWPKKHILVFLSLYSHRNPDGYANPKIKTLARLSGCDKQTVTRALRMMKICFGIVIDKSTRPHKYFLPLNPDIELWEPSRKKAKKVK